MQVHETGIDRVYPNPFNPQTTITYSIGDPGRAVVRVFDVTGRHVKTLVDGHREPGQYQVRWDAFTTSGGLPSGVYFVRLDMNNTSRTQKMLLVK